jgi:hypothetical protein
VDTVVDDAAVTLRPDRGVAGRWTAVGVAATIRATWVALDARDSLVSWAFVALCAVLTSFVLLQLVRPDRFRLVVDDGGVEAHLPWQHVRHPWGRIHLARVVKVSGEPVLELHVWDPEDPSQTSPRATGVLLPVGADLDRLHAELERHLGHAPSTPPDTASGPEPG